MPLILVPTPLGNLRDITLRAIDTIRGAALIVAEDTRVAARLCHALDIVPAQLLAFHAHTNPDRAIDIVERAAKDVVAVLSDAGMPGVSDPGSELVRAARAHNVPVEVLPGPCAFIGAAVLSGLPVVGVQFRGFVARRKSVRQADFTEALASGVTAVYYESPHRIHSALADLGELDPTAVVFVLREYTKHFEQQIFGTPESVAAALSEPVRGEITFVIRRSGEIEAGPPSADATATRIEALLAQELSTSAIAKILVREGHGERNELYQEVQRLRAEQSVPAADESA